MPSTMLETVRCDVCTCNHPRKDMSVLDGICAECFGNEYCLCTDCGRILLQRLSNCGGERVHQYDNDEALCYDCCNARGRHNNRWRPTPLDVSIATYTRVGSKRKYGVEIETSDCPGYETLASQTKFGCKTDCSIRGREFDSPILYGDQGFEEIEALLDYAANKGWDTNSSCGCHTHYDVRDETDEELYRIAYAYAKTHEFWRHCVNNERGNNCFCGRPEYDCAGVRRRAGDGTLFRNFCQWFDRYDYVNLMAYTTHGTLEVRLLEGTVDALTICSWIALHARFMDYVKKLSFDDLDLLLAGDVRHVFDALARIVDSHGLTAWLRSRLETYAPGHLN